MFKYHSDLGQCFSLVVLVSKKSKKKKFFFTFLNWENQTWYWEKGWLFLIGNGAENWPLEMGRKGPDLVNGSFAATQKRRPIVVNAGQKYCRILQGAFCNPFDLR